MATIHKEYYSFLEPDMPSKILKINLKVLKTFVFHPLFSHEMRGYFVIFGR